FDRVRKYGEHPALRYKKDGVWHDISWNEFGRRVETVACALLALGINPGDRVAILSENRPEWAITDLAIISVQGIVVPIYHTLKAKQIEFILQDSGARVLFVSKPALLNEVLQVRENLKDLFKIVLMDADQTGKLPQDVTSFQNLLDLGTSQKSK